MYIIKIAAHTIKSYMDLPDAVSQSGNSYIIMLYIQRAKFLATMECEFKIYVKTLQRPIRGQKTM
jgi:hypothetical protein